jgi:hypothetical protein
MSQHQAFRRTAVDQQIAQKLETITIPAPTRGIIQNENEAFMQPGGAVVMDNWKPTMKGVSLRGGCVVWTQLPETTPVISAFEYVRSGEHRMYAANATKVYEVTSGSPVEVKSGQTSGNYVASQMSNASGDHMLVANDNGDFLLHFDGLTWETFDASQITTDPAIVPPPSCAVGANLSYVCKYRGRYFFIEKFTMNAWYLGLNAIQGELKMIPLSGAATRGGHLLFCATWSIDAGDGIDDKLVFCTDLGELLIFTGGDPGNPANWRQEGRYDITPPLGMNAHILIGGELLVATVDGIVPVSGAITKGRTELELAALTRTIKPLWREHVLAKRQHPWTMCKWEEYGGVFTTLPGGPPGQQMCLATNAATGAHARYTGWDAMCFIRMRGDMFFGTQTGKIMQMDRTGYDDGKPYIATLVGGWEVFQSPSQTVTWRQARASFSSKLGEPFQPQLFATTDYVVVLPQPPLAGYDAAPSDLWDSGLWGPAGSGDLIPPPPADVEAYAQWDTGVTPLPVIRNTGWVSIGLTGFSHAPIVQITVAQKLKPEVDLINIAATFERDGVNV